MTRHKRKLCLNNQDKKFLGVCAGIADYLDVEPWIIRIIFVGAVLFGGWFMIPIYFILWFVMDKDKTRDIKRGINDNPAVTHFKNVDYRKKLYKNTKERKVLGVCAGIADYLEVDVSLVRILTLVAMFLSGFIALIAYIAAYFILDDKPRRDARSNENPEYSKFRDTLEETGASPRTSFKHCSRKFAALHERLIRMEAYVTSSKFRLQREFKSID